MLPVDNKKKANKLGKKSAADETIETQTETQNTLTNGRDEGGDVDTNGHTVNGQDEESTLSGEVSQEQESGMTTQVEVRYPYCMVQTRFTNYSFGHSLLTMMRNRSTGPTPHHLFP